MAEELYKMDTRCLETRIAIPGYTEKIRIEDKGKIFIYSGGAYYLELKPNGRIWGCAHLIKSELTKNWLGLHREKLIWGFASAAYTLFLEKGKRINIENNECHYRPSLQAAAASRGIKLSPKLFEMVFDPIDNAIMEWYGEAMRLDCFVHPL